MRIAIAQMDTRAGDFARTSERMLAAARNAAREGAELIVFGIPVLTGPNPGALSESEGFFIDLTETLARLATEMPIPAVVPAVMNMGRECVYEAVLIRDGIASPLRLIAWQRSESEWGAYPEELGFRLGGVDFGIVFDFHGFERYTHGRAKADCILCLPLYCFNTNDEMTMLAPSVADGCFVGEASASDSWIVAVGAVGGYDEQVFAGGSFVMAPWGELAWAAPSFEETFAVVDVDTMSEGPLAEPIAPMLRNRITSLWDALVIATRDLFEKEGLFEASIILTGDAASSACATLLVDALGPTKVHAFIAPAGDADVSDCIHQLARNLRLEAIEPLAGEGMAEQLDALRALPSSPDALDLLSAIRVRMSAAQGWVCVSPQDKTALALEPARTALPGCVFAPFGDVYRTDLLALARHRNTVSPVIPVPLLSRFRVPSLDGMDASRTSDENLVNEMDAVLLLHIERSLGITAISQQLSTPLVASVIDELGRQGIARETMPFFPVMSDRTLHERDWPLGSAWKDRPREGAVYGADGIDRVAERLFSQLAGGPSADAEFDSEAHITDMLGLLSEISTGVDVPSDPRGIDPFDMGFFSAN
ncbi:MAG: hypothetical protein IJH87_06010 [Atopobiaceae bacterium]|nr:hypothetical protein [Atopobiaceae bacterium]